MNGIKAKTAMFLISIWLPQFHSIKKLRKYLSSFFIRTCLNYVLQKCLSDANQSQFLFLSYFSKIVFF